MAVFIGYSLGGPWLRSATLENAAQLEQTDRQVSIDQTSVDYRRAAELNHYQLFRLSDAEQAYRDWIATSPNDSEAHLGLANLLATCARRHEAVPHYLHLIQLGAVSDFLMLLAKEDGVVVDKVLLQRAKEAAPGDPAPLLGLAWHASESGDRKEAEELLSQAVSLAPKFIPAQIGIATILVDTGRWEDFVQWNMESEEGANDFPQTWVLRGRTAEHQGNYEAAIRCYGEAIRLAPELRLANAALARLLAQVNRPQLAQQFSEYSIKLQRLGAIQDRLFFSKQPNSIDSLLELIESYEAVGRYWEAMGWCQVAIDVEPNNLKVREYGKRLNTKLTGAPLRLTDIAATPAGLLDLQHYPLPTFTENHSPQPARLAKQSPESQPEFREDQEAVGIDFAYFNGAADKSEHRMYEFSGGGIAVIDFDQDSFPDAFFSQGCPWPPQVTPPPQTPTANFSDSLYRNQSGIRFQSAVQAVDFTYDGFGQGATVGDFNSDGFADLYVSNIGPNRLYRNNGDGTFTDVTSSASIDGTAWTTSCVMVDLNGDNHPDIYDVNYVQGEDVYERVCISDDGKPAICMPFDFDASPDVFWINNGTGTFSRPPGRSVQSNSIGKGLGVLAFNDSEGMKLLVANDTTPNFLLSPSNDFTGRTMLVDQGILSGVAFNNAGKAEGSMGIAAGDIDQNGLTDIVITNFLNESNSVYMQQSSGGFVERSQATRLEDTSLRMLGFGTQFLDANLDGQLELFVANGHIDDFRSMGKEYEMRPQFLGFSNGQFEEFLPERLGPYFQAAWLGRAVAKIDWNRDGKEDLLVGHLRSASRLLTNVTATSGNFLAIRLVGIESPRDAIGSTVSVSVGGQTVSSQLTAGDGYQSSNQRQLIIGLGQKSNVEKLQIRWPNGRQQEFANIAANQHLLCVEGRHWVAYQ